MISFPNAKINIGLNITSRRSDGYHNLETVFYPIKIHDALELIEAEELTFSSSGIDIPGDSNDNLCLKALRLISEDQAVSPVHIHLHKHIPIGAGLGGGSSDAAFCLTLLNKKLGLDLNESALLNYAKRLGADCSFFILNRPAFASGTGSELIDISLDLSAYYLVLVKPAVNISTAEAYSNVKPALPSRPLEGLIGLPVEEWRETIVNDFEDTVFARHPEIRAVKEELYHAGAVYASMSGSGSAVYGVFPRKVELPHLEKANRVFYGV